MRKLLMVFLVALPSMHAWAQEDLMSMLDGETEKKKDFVTATFKTNRIINGHSIENTAAGVLDFKISHRFGYVNRGLYEFFGLDQATMRMGLDYGITPKLMVGLGRSTYQKQVDAFLKYKLLRQSTGGKINSPVSVSYMGSVMMNGLRWADPTRKNYFTSRLSFAHQLIVARKFSEGVSLQFMPTFVHINLAEKTTDPNDIFALGVGGRIKLNKRISLTGEYYHILPISLVEGQDYRLPGTKNSIALGFDIETGGHVFQLHFTNSTGMTERSFITETTGDFFKGDIHFGFNISRVFTIKSNLKEK